MLPDELDWRHWVRLYPLAAISLAAVGGFLLGRSRGRELWEDVSSRAADVVTENVHELIGSR